MAATTPKSCWVLLVAGVGNPLVQRATRVKAELECIDDVAKAAKEAFQADLLAHTSAGLLIVYPPGDTSLQNPLEPDAAVPAGSTAKNPILILVPAGMCLCIINCFLLPCCCRCALLCVLPFC